MHPLGSLVVIASLFLAAFCLHHCYALDSRGNPQPPLAGRQKQPPKIDPSCGTTDDLAKKVSICAKPLMDLLQGTVQKWPRSEDDAMKLCESFAWSERCIRDASRKCAKGIQKTIISTLAQSISRARKRECGKSKAAAIVRTTMCLEKEQNTIHTWMSNVTNRLTVIEKEMNEGDKKINGVCCMISDIEKEIKQILDPVCREESNLILRLYRSVLEDVIDLICRNPKCNNYLKGYKIPKKSGLDEIIAILLRVVFSLDGN